MNRPHTLAELAAIDAEQATLGQQFDDKGRAETARLDDLQWLAARDSR